MAAFRNLQCGEEGCCGYVLVSAAPFNACELNVMLVNATKYLYKVSSTKYNEENFH